MLSVRGQHFINCQSNLNQHVKKTDLRSSQMVVTKESFDKYQSNLNQHVKCERSIFS